MRLFTTALCVVLTSACAASQSVSTNMCEAPRSFGGWQGVSVRWTGALLDADHHGMALVATKCRAIAIGLVGLSNTQIATLRAGREAFSISFVEVSGKITNDRTLRVKEINSVRVSQTMSEAEYSAFWNSRS